MKQFQIITIFPEMITPYANASILGKAQEKGLIKIEAHDLRTFADNKHHKVDDTPYGGGAGMVMTIQPFESAIAAVKAEGKRSVVIMTAASGKPFTQKEAVRLAAEADQVIFLCGRYEGIDERVREEFADEVYSIGPYVLTGGELPALVMTDAIARHVPGVLGSEESLSEESHSEVGMLEYPQYTKPETYQTASGKSLAVPSVLLSGNHAEIEKWRKSESQKRSS